MIQYPEQMQYNKSAFYVGSRELLSESIRIAKNYEPGYRLSREAPQIETYQFQIPFSFQVWMKLQNGLKIIIFITFEYFKP